MNVKEKLSSIKEQLKERYPGKTMIRKDRELTDGTVNYNLYFDFPSTSGKEIIKTILIEHGFEPYNYRVIGGSYGYVMLFSIKK